MAKLKWGLYRANVSSIEELTPRTRWFKMSRHIENPKQELIALGLQESSREDILVGSGYLLKIKILVS